MLNICDELETAAETQQRQHCSVSDKGLDQRMPWTGAVEEIRSIIARFPQRELEIRRRCTRDACFRSVCKDYEEAAKALRYWQQAGRDGERMVEEYMNFLGELEEEILDRLDRQVSNVRRS